MIDVSLINKHKLVEKIEELEGNYVNGAFQLFYFPLTMEVLSKEIMELESKESRTEEEEQGLKDRKSLLKTNEMTVKSVEGTIGHLNKTLPYLKSLLGQC